MNAMTDVVPVAPTAEFRTSDTLGELVKALAAASKAFADVVKDREVNMGQGKAKYSYATLGAIQDATQPALREHGLVVVQMPAGRLLVTRLLHVSGEWIEAAAPLPQAQGMGPQAVGSAISYMRRYALAALLQVVADEDDDGNAAQGAAARVQQRPRAQAQGAAQPQRQGSQWNIVSRDGSVEDCGSRAEWEKKWGVKVAAVEKADKSAATRRATLEGMMRANGDVLAALRDSGQEDAVQAVERMVTRADARLAEPAP